MATRSVLHSCNRSNSSDAIRAIVRAHSVLGNVAAGMLPPSVWNRPAAVLYAGTENSWWTGMWWPD